VLGRFYQRDLEGRGQPWRLSAPWHTGSPRSLRPGLWNFGFFTLQNGLPERMVAGREDTWVNDSSIGSRWSRAALMSRPSPNTRRSSEALAAEVAEENPAYLTAWLLDFLSDDHASPDAQNAMATA
jgi:hypothetical protein